MIPTAAAINSLDGSATNTASVIFFFLLNLCFYYIVTRKLKIFIVKVSQSLRVLGILT